MVPCVNTPPRPLPSVGLNTSEGKMGQALGQLNWELWGSGKEWMPAMPQFQGGCILFSCLKHMHKVTEPNSSLKNEDTWHQEEDTHSEGCLGFGIMLRSSWYFPTFSNQEQISLQAPASSHHRLPRALESMGNVSSMSVLAHYPLQPVCIHAMIILHSINWT